MTPSPERFDFSGTRRWTGGRTEGWGRMDLGRYLGPGLGTRNNETVGNHYLTRTRDIPWGEPSHRVPTVRDRPRPPSRKD